MVLSRPHPRNEFSFLQSSARSVQNQGVQTKWVKRAHTSSVERTVIRTKVSLAPVSARLQEMVSFGFLSLS